LDSGRKMLFTADAIYGSRSLATRCISGFHFDPVASVESMEKLESLAKEQGCELFFSHEAETFAEYVKAPGFYS
jgi:4-pyridoxolactonase